MSKKFDSGQFKKSFKRATNKIFINELIINYGENIDLRKQKDRDKITRLGNYIHFRTNFIEQQLKMIIRLTNDNKKLKDICKSHNIGYHRRNNNHPSLTTNDVNKLPGHGHTSSRTDGKPRSSRSRSNSSMYANPPKSPPPSPSLFTIQESPQQEQHRPVASSEKQRELLRRERRQFRVKHLGEPSQQVPNDLLERFAKDDRENPYDEKKHIEQQRVMYNRLAEDRKNDEKLRKQRELEEKRKRGKKRSSVSSDIDLNNMVYGSRRPSQSSGSSSSSGSAPAPEKKQKPCKKKYSVGDMVDITSVGSWPTLHRAEIIRIGPDSELGSSQYLVKFDEDGSEGIVNEKRIGDRWYIAKKSANQTKVPALIIALDKMNIKF